MPALSLGLTDWIMIPHSAYLHVPTSLYLSHALHVTAVPQLPLVKRTYKISGSLRSADLWIPGICYLMASALVCFTASAKRIPLLCNRQRQTARKSGTQSYGPAPGRRWPPSCRTAKITKVNSHESLPVMRRVRAGGCAVLQVVWHPRCRPFVRVPLPIPPVSFTWADSYPLYRPAGAGSSKWCLLLDNRKPIRE